MTRDSFSLSLTFSQYLRTDTSTAFDQVEDAEGSLSCIEKKATIFRHRQDEPLAEELDRMFDAVAGTATMRANEAMGIGNAGV